MTEILSHYKLRFLRILTYTNKRWYYIALKTLCIIIGLPLYVALLPVDILFFLIYALAAPIPFLNVFMLFVCRVVGIICGIGYYIGILPNCRKYYALHLEELKAQAALEAEQAATEAEQTPPEVEQTPPEAEQVLPEVEQTPPEADNPPTAPSAN